MSDDIKIDFANGATGEKLPVTLSLPSKLSSVRANISAPPNNDTRFSVLSLTYQGDTDHFFLPQEAAEVDKLLTTLRQDPKAVRIVGIAVTQGAVARTPVITGFGFVDLKPLPGEWQDNVRKKFVTVLGQARPGHKILPEKTAELFAQYEAAKKAWDENPENQSNATRPDAQNSSNNGDKGPTSQG